MCDFKDYFEILMFLIVCNSKGLFIGDDDDDEYDGYDYGCFLDDLFFVDEESDNGRIFL